MTGLLTDDPIIQYADPGAALETIKEGLSAGTLVPYLGAGVMELAASEDLPPSGPEALAEFLGSKVALPKRARGNAWAAAQYVEAHRHRNTVTALMSEAFAKPVPPTALHTWIASIAPPLIIDTWYDAAMRTALAGSTAVWGEVQGITRAGIGEDCWHRFYDAGGEPSDAAAAAAWPTLLYKPHGGVEPAQNYLISDADYVEVLTEIDIQTPIPDEVRRRRTGRGFVFFGCRFHDQMLRTYARQISKRSADQHYAIVDPETLSRNELRFLSSQGVVLIATSLSDAVGVLSGTAA